jgi:hypothetical protein
VVIVAFVVGAAALAADVPRQSLKSGADWPQWRGADRSGVSPDVGLLKSWEQSPPKLLWTAEGLGGAASVSLAAGRIYTTGNLAEARRCCALMQRTARPLVEDDYRLCARTGKTVLVHAQHRRRPSTRSPPAADRRLKTADGSEVWSRDFKTEWGGRMMSSWGFLVTAGRWRLGALHARRNRRMIAAPDKLTGQTFGRRAFLIQRNGKDGAGYSSIVVSNGGGVKQYVQLVGRGMIGVRASDGQFL